MSALNYNISKRTRTLVQLAFLTAIMILMDLTHLGMIPIGSFFITSYIIPVAIGAIMIGQIGGAVLGFVFGILSFITCFGSDPTGVFLYNVNPFLTAILCIVPRVLCGWIPGLLFELISKKTKTSTVPSLIAAFLCPILNTLFFVSCFVLLFGMNKEVLNYLKVDAVFGIITILITINAPVEIAVGGAVSFSVGKALTHILPKAKQ